MNATLPDKKIYIAQLINISHKNKSTTGQNDLAVLVFQTTARL